MGHPLSEFGDEPAIRVKPAIRKEITENTGAGL